MGPAQSTQQDHGGGQAQDTTERQLPPHIQLQQLQQQLLQLQLEFQQRQQVEQLQQQQQQQPLETEAGSSSTSSQDSPISPGAAGSAMDAASGGGGGEASQPSDPATNRVVLISLMEDVARWSATLERVLECPVCTETMRSPIVLCAGGHSLCGRCGSSCRECPVCRARLVSGRNYLLEELLRLCTDTLPDFEQLENIVTTLAVSEQVTKTEGADPTLEDWAAILSVMDADKILPQTQPLPPTGLQNTSYRISSSNVDGTQPAMESSTTAGAINVTEDIAPDEDGSSEDRSSVDGASEHGSDEDGSYEEGSYEDESYEGDSNEDGSYDDDSNEDESRVEDASNGATSPGRDVARAAGPAPAAAVQPSHSDPAPAAATTTQPWPVRYPRSNRPPPGRLGSADQLHSQLQNQTQIDSRTFPGPSSPSTRMRSQTRVPPRFKKGPQSIQRREPPENTSKGPETANAANTPQRLNFSEIPHIGEPSQGAHPKQSQLHSKGPQSPQGPKPHFSSHLANSLQPPQRYHPPQVPQNFQVPGTPQVPKSDCDSQPSQNTQLPRGHKFSRGPPPSHRPQRADISRYRRVAPHPPSGPLTPDELNRIRNLQGLDFPARLNIAPVSMLRNRVQHLTTGPALATLNSLHSATNSSSSKPRRRRKHRKERNIHRQADIARN